MSGRRSRTTIRDRESGGGPASGPRGLLLADDRAVSEVIGAVLVFALLVTTLSIYQVMAIPGQNASVEYKHSQAVVDDFEAFGAAALGVGDTRPPPPVAVNTRRQ
ncbi:MAG: hypothetical protein V5A23_08670 [Halobacteriales archaeon]